MVVKWKFEDPVTSDVAFMSINPVEGWNYPYEKNVTKRSTIANGGKAIVWQGADQAPDINFSGIFLEEAQYTFMLTWYNKSNQVYLTDDLGRTITILITKFEPKRERAAHSPWKHSYSVTATVLDWP